MTTSHWTWVVGCVVLGLAAAGIQQAGEAPDLAFDSLGSRAVPYFVSASLLVLVTLMFLEEVRQSRSRESKNESRQPFQSGQSGVSWQLCAAGGSLGVYTAALAATEIPFWLATWIFVFATGCVLDRQRSTGWRLTALVATGTATVLQLVFNWLLIDLP